jgi:hypothetical protein
VNTLCLHAHGFFGLVWFFAAVGFELRGSHLLSRRSTTWATLPALFILVTFKAGSCFMPRLASTSIPLFVLPRVARRAGTYYQAQPLVEMGVSWTPLQTGLKSWSFWSLPPKYLGLQAWVTMASHACSFCFRFGFFVVFLPNISVESEFSCP